MIDRFNEAEKYMEYMSYRMACTIHGVEFKTFEKYFEWKESFEYWYINNWWNPNWEFLIEEYEDEN